MADPILMLTYALADHILECQTVLFFFDFLRGAMQFSNLPPLPLGYTAATDQWVSGVLMGYVFPGITDFPVENSDNLFVAVTRDVGGSGGGESRMALVHQGINSAKRTFFQLGTPDALRTGIRETKVYQRSVSPVLPLLVACTSPPKSSSPLT